MPRFTFQHLSILALAVIVCVTSSPRAFDIAVYFEGRSPIEWRSQNSDTMYCDHRDRDQVIPLIENEDQILHWLDEMGTTRLVTHYPFDDDIQHFNNVPLTRMKLLNSSYPGETFKYIYAQYRDLYIGHDVDGWDPYSYVLNNGQSWDGGAVPILPEE